jgi:hypothetical protein
MQKLRLHDILPIILRDQMGFPEIGTSHGSDPAASSNLQDPEALMAKVERGQMFHHLMTMKGWAK